MVKGSICSCFIFAHTVFLLSTADLNGKVGTAHVWTLDGGISMGCYSYRVIREIPGVSEKKYGVADHQYY